MAVKIPEDSGGLFAKAIKNQTTVIGGQNSNTVGSDNTNLILKGKAVKVQWGNRFIDLIKDGKINVENQEILKIISDTSFINENGIYIISDTNEVWVCINGQKINLTGGSYLSFMVEQKLTPEQKYITLSNAGFYYKTLTEAQNIQGGIVYIEDEGKLYIVKDNKLQEYSFTQQSSKDELTIGDLKIYKDKDMTIESPSLILSINKVPYIIIDDQIKIYKDVVISKNAMVQSQEATAYQGFRLYNLNGLSTLEIDNIIEREKYEDNAVVYSSQSNLITEQTIIPDEGSSVCTLLYKNQFEVDDKIYVFVKYTNILKVEYEGTIVTITTTSPVTSDVKLLLTVNAIEYTAILEKGNTEVVIDFEGTIESFNYKIEEAPDNVSTADSNKKNLFIFTVREITENTIKIDTVLDCVNCSVYREPLIKIQQGTLEVIDEDKSVVKIGVLTEEDKEGNVTKYPGIYSKCYEGYTRKFFFGRYPKYDEGITYPTIQKDEEGDEEVDEFLKKKYNQVVPNIEWIKKLISNYFPIGTIIMYSGSADIPEDWTICDGSHGSPNLIGKFIKASDTIGETIVHENNEITLTADNLPQHSHSYTIGDQTSTGSISNTTSTGSISNTKSTGSISNVTTTGTIGNTTSTGTFNGTYGELKSNIYSPTSMGYAEIINIPRDDKGNISDSTIKNWGVSTISYDAGDFNYSGYISMNPHSHELTMDEHSHSLTMNEHGHTLTIDEHGHTLTMNSHSHSISEQSQEWKNTPIKIEPNYYSLIFIMKWK